MTERETRQEREPQPRLETGVFRLNVRGVPLEFDPDGKAHPAGGEPRFAVKDVMVLHTREGWAEFAEKLAVHLEGAESELYRGMAVYAVAESPMTQLTDHLQPGEIHLVSDDEYAAAYYSKYGDAIQGPIFW